MTEILSSPAGDGDSIDFEIRNGRVVPRAVMTKRDTPVGVGFVDQISFTFTDDFHRNVRLLNRVRECGGRRAVTDSEVITDCVEPILRDAFGLTVSHQRSTGLNFYKDTWVLKDGAGMVSIGGQNDTILVQITGQGMAMARKGWEARLRSWRAIMSRFVITRLDLAYDDIDGKLYSVDRARQDWLDGRFTMRGRPPTPEMRGNWLMPDGSGRSFYVGRRENGKMLRAYEKGRQLGERDSEWLRVELELHNKDREIPFEAVESPGAFLAGSYSALAWVAAAEPTCKITTIRKVTKITYDALVGHLRRSYGGLLSVILEVEESALGRLAEISQGRPEPKRLAPVLSALNLAV